MQSITREGITTALELHGRAYEALLWLSNISFARPQMLTSQSSALLQKADACVDWVSAHLHDFPARVQPTPDNVQAFARLFASFFQTSFRIERRVHTWEQFYRITRNRDEAAGRDRLSSRKVPRGLVRKRKDEATHLKYRAMTYLQDENTPGFWDGARELIAESSVRRELVFWTWACELVHRSRGEPHGPAVHMLWRQMDEPTRKQISTERI
ncbi:MAG TPA: hypothetical protein VFW23_07310 [Tepidisphaeraceae bacterium]|nr:hypothetical protein [Tepidisphaeraceae bacterium]